MYDWQFADDALTAWARLRQASEAMEKVLETGLGKYNHATLTQIDVLGILSASKISVTPGAIASYTFSEQHSASALLSRMWRKGLIRKTRSMKAKPLPDTIDIPDSRQT